MNAAALRWAAGLLAAVLGMGAAWADPGNPERGRAIYDRGTFADGSAVQAERPGAGPVPPHAVACVQCHRPSLMGGTEGGVFVPPITGELLFAAGQPPLAARQLQRQWLRHQTRGAYSAALLARAMVSGLDPDGTELHAAMPRYALDAQALADLEAFIRLPRGGPYAGVEPGVMHLATVVTPQAAPQRRRTVLEAMEAWSRGMALGRTQVRWRAWELRGEPSTWEAQLQAHRLAQPVYALVSGAGAAEWGPVHAFCEAQALACLFPVLDRAPGPPAGHWSVYLSGGVEAEARMLAQHWRDLPLPPARVLQLHAGDAGGAAARALARALAEAPIPQLSLSTRPLDADAGEGVVGLPLPDLVVLWLPTAQAQQWLAAQARSGRMPGLVLSAQLAPPHTMEVDPAWRPRLNWVSLHADPALRAAGAALSLVPWAQRLHLAADLDPADLADVHAATFFFADALAQTRGLWQPEHLLERLELAVDRRPAGSGYFRLSLGPGQRIAAQGGYLLGYKPPRLEQLAPLAGYLRADE